jgi:hypothetical protein
MEEIVDSGAIVEAAAPEVEVNEAPQEQNVPLQALQAERAQRQQVQDELRVIREQMSLMNANNQPKQEDDSDDILTKGELKQYMGSLHSQYESRFGEMEMARKHPDYEEVVTKYLPEVIKSNPRLRQTLEQTQDYELAYTLAKNSDAYREGSNKKKKNADAERIMKNSQSPGSLSSVGSSSPISEAKRYKDMSDSDFQALMNKNRGQY